MGLASFFFWFTITIINLTKFVPFYPFWLTRNVCISSDYTARNEKRVGK
jgi:hypothetical protein